MRLRPGDPHAAPLVDPAYLTDRTDAPHLIAGLRRALDLGSAASMSPFLGAANRPPRADGSLTGHAADRQRELLAAESVPFRGPNVDLPAARWHS